MTYYNAKAHDNKRNNKVIGMITTVTLNPCIDKTVTIDGFTYGGMNRIIDSRIDPSGKGINVAIAYSQLGGQALCTGINYRINGDLIEQRLDRQE